MPAYVIFLKDKEILVNVTTEKKMVEDTSQVKKALVSLAIEESLLEIGGNKLLNDVFRILFEKHNDYLPDCYESPDHLKTIYEHLDSGTWKIFVEFLNRKLSEFAYQKEIGEFMTKINRIKIISV